MSKTFWSADYFGGSQNMRSVKILLSIVFGIDFGIS